MSNDDNDREVAAVAMLAAKTGSAVYGNRLPDGSLEVTVLDTGEKLALGTPAVGDYALPKKPWWRFWQRSDR